jgi:hypothetical protein
VTEEGKREFFQLVVEKETAKCWSWIGEHDADGKPLFRGEKAYRVMYRLRVGDVPDRFHVHHKCENSACINPRHLVALSPDAHRAVHATEDRTLKERIYRGEWRKIQEERDILEEGQRLVRERMKKQRTEEEREEENYRRRLEDIAAKKKHEMELRREERRKRRVAAFRKFRLYGLPALVCYLLMQLEITFQWIPREPVGVWVAVILFFSGSGFLLLYSRR